MLWFLGPNSIIVVHMDPQGESSGDDESDRREVLWCLTQR